jgi:hypothetical protein
MAVSLSGTGKERARGAPLSARHHRRQWSPAGSGGEQVRVLRVLVDELGDEPAPGDDVAPAPADLVECPAHEDLAQTTTAQAWFDLGMREHDGVAHHPVVGDAAQPAVDEELIARPIRVVAYFGVHKVLLERSTTALFLNVYPLGPA